MFKPMLASKVEDPNDIEFPVLVSPKLDGVRCLILNGVPLSRNMKPIRNKVIHEILHGLPQFDGELIVGSPMGPGVFTRSSSGVMREEGAPEFRFHVFDIVTTQRLPYNERYKIVTQMANPDVAGKCIIPVIHKLVKNVESLLAYEEQMVVLGFEGIMIRSLDGPYKNGRSTWREGYLLKLKRFEDAEATVTGVIEKEHNDNELTQDELGRAKRSSHKAGKRLAGVLGSLVVRTDAGVEFQVGAGFSDSDRSEIWINKDTYIGQRITYRFQPSGVLNKPRFPTFIGFRDEADADA